MKILLTGASGLLGKRLTLYFQEAGATVIPILRVAADEPSDDGVAWNTDSGWMDRSAMEGASVLIHVAGENIGDGRWTKAKKERIYQSRITGTRQLVQSLGQLNQAPQTFFCASATGFCGTQADSVCTEHSPVGDGFLAQVCADWEGEALKAAKLGIRTIPLRFGVILDAKGGALGKMLLPFRLGLGGTLGNGSQYFPWIAAPEIPKVIDALHHKLKNISGPVNVVAPEQVTNKTFTRTLAQHLHRPAFIPLPAFAIRTLLGEMGREMFLGSCNAIPSALENSGYSFTYPTLESALEALLPR